MLSTFLNVALMIFGFGMLIFVHELGHFLAARWAGIRAEAFAIGMGPVACSYRKGIGWKLGSTGLEYERRVQSYLKSDAVHAAKTTTGKELTQSEFFNIGDKLGLGETEYSIRWLPIGGFVKMLGQEDANPNAVSDDPRSYGRCPVGKRMVVVSAGVAMNLILAVVLFIWAFMVGVDFEAPVIGSVVPNSPAAMAKAVDAETLGITEPGLHVNDTILSIDDDAAETFADIKINTAMARADEALRFKVQRPGIDEPLTFHIQAKKNKSEGLLSIGVAPAQTTKLIENAADDSLVEHLTKVGLTEYGVKPGMQLVSVNGSPVKILPQVQSFIDASEGHRLDSQWRAVDAKGEFIAGEAVNAQLTVEPVYSIYGSSTETIEAGLIGLPMLVKVNTIEKSSANFNVLKPGDIIVGCADTAYPRFSQFRDILKKHPGEKINVEVLRDGAKMELSCQVSSKGLLGFGRTFASEELICAQPFEVVDQTSSFIEQGAVKEHRTPVAEHNLMAGTRILTVDGQRVTNWSEFRSQLLRAVKDDATHSVTLSVQLPQENAPIETLTLSLDHEDVHDLTHLGWQLALDSNAFEPHYVTLTAEGNPLRAIAMGVKETRKSILGAYLTLDRLVRGTVGVDQLRGPVGIVHMGATIADRGFMYLVFFMGMISVNLAVINFLPMPIVDGGLFLFLVYEKIKGKQPSLAFQNAATIVGLFLIGTVFLITFYNDVTRLFS